MNLFLDEEVIIGENEDEYTNISGRFTLTNRRAQLTRDQFGVEYLFSIFLEDIRSIEVKYRTKTSLLILALVLFAAALYIERFGAAALLPGIGGCVALVYYGRSRQVVVSIGVAGGKYLNLLIGKATLQKTEALITTIEQAKYKRIQEMFSKRQQGEIRAIVRDDEEEMDPMPPNL